MTDLRIILLGLLSRHCRGPASARKIWKVADDLRTLGLDATPRAVLDAAAGLRRQGFPVVVTAGDLPAAYIEERRRRRGADDWRTFRRTRGQALAVRPSADARALAEAERFYARLLADALARAEATAGEPGRPVPAHCRHVAQLVLAGESGRGGLR